MAHLFQGTQEMSYIAHVMGYAACVGPNQNHCSKPAVVRISPGLMCRTEGESSDIPATVAQSERISASFVLALLSFLLYVFALN
jgi:hypothetical protein